MQKYSLDSSSIQVSFDAFGHTRMVPVRALVIKIWQTWQCWFQVWSRPLSVSPNRSSYPALKRVVGMLWFQHSDKGTCDSSACALSSFHPQLGEVWVTLMLWHQEGMCTQDPASYRTDWHQHTHSFNEGPPPMSRCHCGNCSDVNTFTLKYLQSLPFKLANFYICYYWVRSPQSATLLFCKHTFSIRQSIDLILNNNICEG